MSPLACHRLLFVVGLLLALMAWAEGVTTLYYVEEGTIKRLTEGSKAAVNVTSYLDTRAWALAYDEVEGRIYFSDFRSRLINSTSPDGSSRARLKQLNPEAEPYGLTLDSAARLLFYTDAKHKVIMMQTLKGGLTRTVRTETLDLPRAITLDTVKGIIYYTDYGLRPMVAKVNYDGTDSKVLISTDIGLPTGIAMDQPANLLYWCDALFDRISSYHVVTGQSRTIFQMTQVTFLDLKLFDNHLYFSLFNHSVIERLSLDNSNRTQVEMNDTLTARVTSMAFVDDRPRPTPFTCNCSHICIPSPSGQRKCICPDGLFLQADGTTCSVDPYLDNFLLFVDVGLDQLFRIDVASAKYFPLPVVVSNPWGITFNILNNRVYWTEITEMSIHSAALDGTDQKKVLQLSPGSVPYGLDVDPKAGLIFYSDTGHDVIGKMTLDGSNHSAVLASGLDDVRCLVLDIVDKVIFYTDGGGQKPKIARVKYDGTEPRTMVNSSLLNPIGLALDKDGGRLYWCDYSLEHIDSTDLNGANRIRLVQFLNTKHYALTLFQRVLYFTDLNVERISQVGTHGVGYSAFSDNDFYFIVDLHAVDRNQELRLMGLPTVVPPSTTTTLTTTSQTPPTTTTSSTTEMTTTTSTTTTMTTASSTTRTTATSTMEPEVRTAPQTGAVQTAGYSAGAMAGAIIATILIVLAVLILVAVLLYKRRHISLHRAAPQAGNPGGLAFFNPMSEPYRTLEEEGVPGGHRNPAMISDGAMATERSPPPTYSSAQAPSKAELALAQQDTVEGAVGGVAVTLPYYGKD